MIKSILLMVAFFIFSNNVSGQPEPDPKHTEMVPESAALSESAPLPEIAEPIEIVKQYEEAELVCTKERKTGSRIYTKTCRSKAVIEAERASGQEFLRKQART